VAGSPASCEAAARCTYPPNHTWCETGWYSSPAVADLNHDNRPEVIAASYTVRILGGRDGGLIRSYQSAGGGRAWPGVVIEEDGKTEEEFIEEIICIND
jgi:hypothetical protein